MPSAPAAPSDVTATGGDSQVIVAWTAVEGATGYQVYYQAGNSASTADEQVTATMIRGTTATITGLTRVSQYAFVVVANNAGGDSSASTVVTATNWSTAPKADMTSVTVGLLKGIAGGTMGVASATITVSSFRMMCYPVTQAMYQTVIGSNPSYFSSNASTCPVEQVSWYDALIFCNKLSLAEGLTPVYSIGGSTVPADWGSKPSTPPSTWDEVTMNMAATGYRLPTSCEYYWAMMGGQNDSRAGDIVGGINTGGFSKGYAGSNETAGAQVNIANYAWYSANSAATTHPVGGKLANELGLYDLTGNVYQWLWDGLGGPFVNGQVDYTGPVTADGCRSIFGISWYSNSTISGGYAVVTNYQLGFRVVCR